MRFGSEIPCRLVVAICDYEKDEEDHKAAYTDAKGDEKCCLLVECNWCWFRFFGVFSKLRSCKGQEYGTSSRTCSSSICG